MKLEVKFHAF